MVVHHGGNAVAHGTLVAPAGRDGGGGGFRLWKGPPIHAVGDRAHLWHCPSVPAGPPPRPPCPKVGPFSGPREAPSGCSAKWNPGVRVQPMHLLLAVKLGARGTVHSLLLGPTGTSRAPGLWASDGKVKALGRSSCQCTQATVHHPAARASDTGPLPCPHCLTHTWGAVR